VSLVALEPRAPAAPTEPHPLAERPPAEDAGFSGVGAALREHAPLLALLALYCLARVAWTGGQWPLDRELFVALALVFALITMLGLALVATAHAFRVTHRQPGSYAAFRLETWVGFRREYLSSRRLTSVVLAWLLLSVLMTVFMHWKADLGTRIPFSWDERFMRWDRTLHFGRHPWEWLHPLLAHPHVTHTIDTLYHRVWVLGVKAGSFLLIAWWSNRALVSRFLLTYMLLWIVAGTLVAYGLASAGPVYYADVLGPVVDPYAALLAYLGGVDAVHGLTAVGAAAQLWESLIHDDWPRIGISAMPSMHVALTTLIAVVGFQIHRIWGVLGTLYLIIVLLGSVHLGWHYAIDGYLSILLVWVLWWAAGKWPAWKPAA
jgi:hypothetical protein